ncbi:hemolysin family protein [Nocardiopsis halophila]|uniref:hemolysin family protein n=1 Tax=Nocardiopsis halophila TaxID=141692 RepID=UPI0003467955|nr:hemolysin family protein [Nocardiopsis halophila]
MDLDTLVNLGLVLAFVLLGGVFAGTELALVSLRESQIRQLEKRGRRGAKVAAVARNPNRFLSAVQIGVTVTGFFSAAYGASTLAPDFAPLLVEAGLPEPLAAGLALVALTLFVAYLSLVLGELVPKRFALQRAAGISLVVAPPLDRFATAMRPVIWLLSVSTDAVVRLFGGDPSAKREDVSREELREMVTANADLATDEREIVADVFQAADRSLREVMRPRVEVEFLDADMEIAEAAARVADRPYSRYPLKGEDIDDIVGFLHVRDLLSHQGGGGSLRGIMRPIPALPSTNKALAALGQMRDARTHIAVVVNEYGGTDGIVTLEDLVEELVGDIRDEHDLEGPPAGTENGSGTYDAGLRLEEFAEQAGFALPEGPYETVGGLVMHRLGRIPAEGDAVTVEGRVITVVQTSGNRTRLVKVAGPASEASGPSERP